MIELKQLVKQFESKTILDQINLQVPLGKKVTIIGPSGSGKSTILKLILGLIMPDQGQIVVEGVDIGTLSLEKLYLMRQKIGLLFQSGALFDSMTVAENVGFALNESPTSLTKQEIKYKVDVALDLVEMQGFDHMFPSELSGGQQKRVGLARAIVNNPNYILYDEPTTGLDPILSTNIENLINRLADELNTSTIVVTHQLSTIMRTSDEIYYLHQGKLFEPETPVSIKTSSNIIINNFIHGKSHD